MMRMLSVLAACALLQVKFAAAQDDTPSQCFDTTFLDYVEDSFEIRSGEKIHRNFRIKGTLKDSYEPGEKVEIECDFDSSFAYTKEGNEKFLECGEDGEVTVDGQLRYNFCMRDDYCSIDSWERDWPIPGYKISKKMEEWMDGGPIIAKAFTESELINDLMPKVLKEVATIMPGVLKRVATSIGNKKPKDIASAMTNTGSMDPVTYPPMIPMECGADVGAMTLTVLSDPRMIRPHAFCYKQAGSKKAKWSMGPSQHGINLWSKTMSKCIPLLTFSRNSPPPDGCTVLSKEKAECRKYDKYCAWRGLEIGTFYFDPKVIEDERVCRNYDCVSWACYAGLRTPINCEEQADQVRCDSIKYPAHKFWCKWIRQESRCAHKAEDDDDNNIIKVDVCATC